MSTLYPCTHDAAKISRNRAKLEEAIKICDREGYKWHRAFKYEPPHLTHPTATQLPHQASARMPRAPREGNYAAHADPHSLAFVHSPGSSLPFVHRPGRFMTRMMRCNTRSSTKRCACAEHTCLRSLFFPHGAPSCTQEEFLSKACAMCDEFSYKSDLYKEAKALLKNIQKAKVRQP